VADLGPSKHLCGDGACKGDVGGAGSWYQDPALQARYLASLQCDALHAERPDALMRMQYAYVAM